MPISILIEKEVIFSHACRGLSRSLHAVTTHMKLPGFKQLNWRIREKFQLNLFTAFEDWLKTHETSPWNEHHYFQFYKLGVGKVINRFHLPCTPLKTAVQNFQAFCSNHEACFEEILSLSIKYFVINREIGLDGDEHRRYKNSSHPT